MEALPSLPPELLVLVDPTVRGPAALLASRAAETDPAAAPMPFELYLALMTASPPTGEAWPATGKELPAAPSAVAASAPQPTSPFSTSAGDAALLARLGSPATDVIAQAASADPLLVLGADQLGAPLPASGTQPVSPLEALPPQTPSTAEAAATVPTETATALPSAIAELAAESASADGVDFAAMLEPDARAPRLQPQPQMQSQPSAAEQTAPARARGALGAPDLRAAETAPHDGALEIEVTNVSRTVLPAVAETSRASADWVPASHTTASTPQPMATQQPAAAGSPVDTRAPDWHEAFATRVQWLAGSNGGEARISLNPPELGAVDVKVSLVDDKTYVQLTTATAAARDELAHSLPRLRELLAASGIELGGATVNDNRDGQRAGFGAGAGGGDRGALPEPRTPAWFADVSDEPPTALVPRRTLGRIDLFA